MGTEAETVKSYVGGAWRFICHFPLRFEVVRIWFSWGPSSQKRSVIIRRPIDVCLGGILYVRLDWKPLFEIGLTRNFGVAVVLSLVRKSNRMIFTIDLSSPLFGILLEELSYKQIKYIKLWHSIITDKDCPKWTMTSWLATYRDVGVAILHTVLKYVLL